VKVLVNKKFLKDLARIPASDRKKIEAFVFDESEKIESIESVGIFKKLRGYSVYYRIRFGDYRVGIKYENDILVFERVLHRKEIYRFFP
jgi:mRNA interferase RelE/StbE